MEVNDTMILTVIHKEKKEKDYRMIIVPSGKSKIGIGQMKNRRACIMGIETK